MSFIKQSIGFIVVSLFIINGLLGGGVADAIGTFATDEEKAQARLDLACGLGYILYKPVIDFHGINVPMPSYTNVLISALAALSIILIIRIITGIDWKFKYSLLIFVLTWMAIKILGYSLMMYSGNDCMSWAEEEFSSSSGFWEALGIGGSIWGLKIIWGLRK